MEVVAIIPAFNEEKNIGQVLSTLIQIEEITNILVVNDGSSDRTGDIANSCGVRVLNFNENQGKSMAMYAGVKNTKEPVIIFLDADLIGLRAGQIKDMILPVVEGHADMTLGIFSSGRSMTDLAQKIAPSLTGQRVIKRWVLDDLSYEDWTAGFGIELTITRLAKNSNIRVMEIPLENTTHSMKEEKLGLFKGIAARFKMYWEIIKQLG